MPDITMPKLSDTMEEGKILRWLKQPGQPIEAGEVLVEVETDKADMEIEAEHDGVLEEIRLREGDSGPVGAVIAVIGDGAAPVASDTTTSTSPTQDEPQSAPGSISENPAPEPAEVSAPQAEPEPAHSTPVQTPPPAPPVAQATAANASARATGAAPSVGTTKVSPLARTRAAELGVDPSTLVGTGPGGRVTRKDVEEAHRSKASTAAPAPPTPAVRATPPAPGQAGSGTITVRPPPVREQVPVPPVRVSGDGAVQRIPLTGMRAAIARRMTESKREAPHFYVSTVANMDAAVEMRKGLKAAGGAASGVTYNHLILKACADALRASPEMNSRFVGDAIEILPDINIGMATAVPDGLVVPVIHNADKISLLDVGARARELAEKAKQRNFGGNDLSGATFSVSNLGMYDVEDFVAVINPPQAAILAVGSVAQRPVVRDGELGVSFTVHLTVSCDHRAVDGARAAEFLAEVRARLENPVRLFLEA